jgi:hypothetical protein
MTRCGMEPGPCPDAYPYPVTRGSAIYAGATSCPGRRGGRSVQVLFFCAGRAEALGCPAEFSLAEQESDHVLFDHLDT